ncbi:hypothetical protein E2C01_057643 [Portunus trituberculatus]|uniref:Uncharacterized protein n=1 Tax=Portunus trituberculatus TaxID=210409 RepID=A0A5B7H1P6_PORTR|nr:hypothetical protein [Portunus trituberculatus]
MIASAFGVACHHKAQVWRAVSDAMITLDARITCSPAGRNTGAESDIRRQECGPPASCSVLSKARGGGGVLF